MISTMFDLATKLASLSDISFLLLVESRGKTKFAGSRHLTDAYLMSDLCQFVDSDGLDLEMQFDPNPLPKVVVTHKTGRRNDNSMLKRRFADSVCSLDAVDSSEFTGKSLRLEQSDDDDIIEERAPTSSAMRPDSFNENIDNQFNGAALTLCATDPPFNGANSTFPSLNNNLSTINGNHKTVSEDRERGGRGGGRGGEDDKEEIDVVVKEEGDAVLSSNNQSGTDDETPSVSPSEPSICSLIRPFHDFSGNFEWDVREFLESSEKRKFVAKIETASLVLDKDSTEFKLLHSLIYELSKTAATFCPFVEASDPRTSQYFANVFDTFWSYVPFLQQLHVDGVLPGNKATSKYKNLKSLLRWKMQKNFGVLMKKYNVRCRN